MSEVIEEFKEFLSDMIDAISILSYIAYKFEIFKNPELAIAEITRIWRIFSKYDLTLDLLNDLESIKKDIEQGIPPYTKCFDLVSKLKSIILDRIGKLSI